MSFIHLFQKKNYIDQTKEEEKAIFYAPKNIFLFFFSMNMYVYNI